MKYRAKQALHDHSRKRIIRKGSEVDPDLPGFKHWMSKGYIEEISDDTPTVDKETDVSPDGLESVSPVTGETAVADLKFIKPNMSEALTDAGVAIVSDLDGWTEEMLMELPHIGEATANNLLLAFSELNGSD